jgi:hypothetical protein
MVPAMGGNPGLRPLSFGEILDVALKIFGRHWRTLVACVLVPTIPIQIVSVLVILSIAPEQYDPNTGPTASSESTGTEIAAVLVVQLLSLIASLLAWAACFKAVADGYLGQEPSLGGSLRFGLPRIPRLFGLSVVTGVMIVIGVFGCLVGALLVAALVILSVPAMLLERIGIFAAIGRSFELVKGRYWQTVLMLLVLFAGLLVITLVLGVIFGAVAGSGSETANAIGSFVASVAASAVGTPIFASILTVFYFDQRVRKEGFDLQLLAQGIGEEAPTTVQQPWQQPQAPSWPPSEPSSPSWPPSPQPGPEQGPSGGSSGWQPPSGPPPGAGSPPPPGPSQPPPGSPGGS